MPVFFLKYVDNEGCNGGKDILQVLIFNIYKSEVCNFLC